MKKRWIYQVIAIICLLAMFPLRADAAGITPPENCFSVDNGTNNGAVGYIGTGYAVYLNRLSGLEDKTVTNVWIFYGNEASNSDPGITAANILIYSQGASQPATLLYTQPIDVSAFSGYGWKCIKLTTPLTSSEDTLFIGLDAYFSNHGIFTGKDTATDGGTNSFAGLDAFSMGSLAGYGFPNNYMIRAEYVASTHNITGYTSTGGTVTADKTATAAGDTVNITVTPAEGYRLVAGSLKYNDTAILGTSFVMPESDVAITADFELIPRSISVEPTQNGTVAADKTIAVAGDTISLTFVPDEGYRLVPGSLKYNDTALTGNTFVMPGADVTIHASFELLPEIVNTKVLIIGLPEVISLTENDFAAVVNAKNAYDSLTETQKNLIDAGLSTKLVDAVRALSILLLQDEATGTKVEGIDGTVLDFRTTLSITPIMGSISDQKKVLYAAEIEKAAKGQQLVQLFDIRLLINGQPVQPAGNVKVTLKMTEEMKKYTNLQIVYLEEDGKATIIPHTVSGGEIMFVTNHFSNYGVIGTPAKAETIFPTTTQAVQTGDSTMISIYIILVFISLAIAFCFGRKKYNRHIN